ncbi:MAG: hypothetical protein WEB56_10880 [Roseovarius sp.]
MERVEASKAKVTKSGLAVSGGVMGFVQRALVCAMILIGTASAAAACGAHDNSGHDAKRPNGSGMSAERIGRLVCALDPGAVAQGHGWRLSIEGQLVLLTIDVSAGRLRAMVPIRVASGLDAPQRQRMLQANFDAALDARYAISDGLIWSLFVRPLDGLNKTQLVSGLAQVVTLARSYGTSFSSGVLRLGRRGAEGSPPAAPLIERLLQRGQDI